MSPKERTSGDASGSPARLGATTRYPATRNASSPRIQRWSKSNTKKQILIREHDFCRSRPCVMSVGFSDVGGQSAYPIAVGTELRPVHGSDVDAPRADTHVGGQLDPLKTICARNLLLSRRASSSHSTHLRTRLGAIVGKPFVPRIGLISFRTSTLIELS
jgi:hypothetical protein